MKPFDLKAAKKGAPVCTRDGRDVRIICFDRDNDNYPIVALVKSRDGSEEMNSFTINGRFYTGSDLERPADLLMKSVKKEGWINIYSDSQCSDIIHPSKCEAKEFATCEVIDTVRIEWEE
jgi:hypothetical protein